MRTTQFVPRFTGSLLTIATTVGLMLAMGLFISPASAAVPGLVRISASSVLNQSEDFKDVTATCPTGKNLVGTGFEITGGQARGEVVLDDLRPNGSPTTAPTAVSVRAHEADPISVNWGVQAHAICANSNATLRRFSATSILNGSEDFKTATATCPVGKKLVGTGAEITGGRGEVVLDDLRPNGGPTLAPTAVTVGAYEAEPYMPDWTVTAYAICADPLPGLVQVTDSSDNSSTSPRAALMFCPTGKKLLGQGAEITGATGEVVFHALRSNGSPTVAPTFAFVEAYEEDPFTPTWTVTVYAICADE